jgi:hypothetical protein
MWSRGNTDIKISRTKLRQANVVMDSGVMIQQSLQTYTEERGEEATANKVRGRDVRSGDSRRTRADRGRENSDLCCFLFGGISQSIWVKEMNSVSGHYRFTNFISAISIYKFSYLSVNCRN